MDEDKHSELRNFKKVKGTEIGIWLIISCLLGFQFIISLFELNFIAYPIKSIFFVLSFSFCGLTIGFSLKSLFSIPLIEDKISKPFHRDLLITRVSFTQIFTFWYLNVLISLLSIVEANKFNRLLIISFMLIVIVASLLIVFLSYYFYKKIIK